MRNNSIYTLRFRRKKKGLTDYRKRIKILSSNKTRLVVRKSTRNVQASIVQYRKEGDLVKLSFHSENLKKFGWNYSTKNIPAAYLVGYLLGKKATNAKSDEVILDIGLQKSVRGSRIYAVLAGALDAGLKVPHAKDILPSKDRLNGSHISKYGEMLKKDGSRLKRQFGGYLKNNVQLEVISKKFEEVRGNIEKNTNK